MTFRRIASGGPYEQKIGYCRVVEYDRWIMVSGCTGADLETGAMPGEVVLQCRNALTVVRNALARCGAGFEHVARVTYILPDRADFEPCWPLLRDAFGAHPPAATMIQAGLISEAMKIEIEVTARKP